MIRSSSAVPKISPLTHLTEDEQIMKETGTQVNYIFDKNANLFFVITQKLILKVFVK